MISLTLLTELYDQDHSYRKARLRLKERLQIIFPELLFLSYSKNIPQIVIGNINNIQCMDFIVSHKKKVFRFVDDKLQTDIKKYDAGCSITPLATKTRRSICTWPTVTKVLDKLSRVVSIKRTSCNCRNGEATYSNKILFIWHPEEPFSLQNTLCLVWNKSLFFIFCNMC